MGLVSLSSARFFLKKDRKIGSSDIAVVSVLGSDRHVVGQGRPPRLDPYRDGAVEEDAEPPTGLELVVNDGRGPVLTPPDVPVAARHVVVVLVVNEERLTTREDDVRHPETPI